MDTLVKADVFFFITSVFEVVIGILLITALVYAIKTLKDLREFSRRALKEGDHILKDVKNVHEYVKEKTDTVGEAINTLENIVSSRPKRRRKKASNGQE